MKAVIVILILMLLALAGFSQGYANWATVPGEPGISNYVLQDSVIGATGWADIATITAKKQADTNYYSYPLTVQNVYYRVKAGEFYTKAQLYTAILPVVISDYGIKPGTTSLTLYWTGDDENGIKNYEIDRSFDGVAFSNVATVALTSGAKYSVTIDRPVITSSACEFRLLGICFSKKKSKTIDTRKEILQIIAVNTDKTKKLLTTISE